MSSLSAELLKNHFAQQLSCLQYKFLSLISIKGLENTVAMATKLIVYLSAVFPTFPTENYLFNRLCVTKKQFGGRHQWHWPTPSYWRIWLIGRRRRTKPQYNESLWLYCCMMLVGLVFMTCPNWVCCLVWNEMISILIFLHFPVFLCAIIVLCKSY